MHDENKEVFVRHVDFLELSLIAFMNKTYYDNCEKAKKVYDEKMILVKEGKMNIETLKYDFAKERYGYLMLLFKNTDLYPERKVDGVITDDMVTAFWEATKQ